MPREPLGSSMTRTHQGHAGGPSMQSLTLRRKATATTVVAILATALLLGTLTSAPAHATVPGPNGLIVYQATVGKHIQLFTVRSDGRGVRRLTRFTDSDAVHASWSPDGTRLIFERDFAKRAGIYTMNVDGTDIRSLTPKGLDQGLPAYSPDGAMIVFDRPLPREDALWVMNAEAGGIRQLTHN